MRGIQTYQLHQAVVANNADMVASLLRNGVSVNVQDANGRTALHEAVLKNNLVILEMLLIEGANPNIKAGDGSSPLGIALQQQEQNEEVIDLLLAYSIS